MNYDKAVEALKGALKFGIDPSLEPITKLCAALGSPQDAYRCVQVAGTNGKSSTTRMTAAILHEQGLKVGLYTSPELVRYPERMEIDGSVVSDQDFADAIDAALKAAGKCALKPTEFEILTAAALWLFAEKKVDVAVLECGLGGRWDATSVCSSRVAVITGIGLDHTRILGDTIEAIAAEKAAIIKPGCKAVLAPELAAREVFDERVAQTGVECIEVDPLVGELFATALAHMPSYQRQNAAVAFAAAKALVGPIALEDAQAALSGLQIPGRFETLCNDPLLIIDAAHNPQSASVLAKELCQRFRTRDEGTSGKPEIPTLLLGILADKDAHGIVETLVPLFNRIVVSKSASPRSLEVSNLAVMVEECAKTHRKGGEPAPIIRTAPDIASALELLEGESVIATGSITVAGEVKAVWC